MCGIAGFYTASHPEYPDRLIRVGERLGHRGPDDSGWLCYCPGTLRTGREWNVKDSLRGNLFLIHRRLSVLDLTKNGWQPMATPDGRYYVVYNGEIYNYIELKGELKQLGHSFRTHTDTEVLLAAYSQWGIGALGRFTGMFSFALLDTARAMLVLARDFFGIKPMYYSATADSLIFASEIKALLGCGAISLRGNPERLYFYLRYGTSDDGPQTMLTDIRQLPAGHYMEIPLRRPLQVNPVCYWKPAGKEGPVISFAESARRLREVFLNNVRLHLRSDVPVGVALSGGIDSSSILAAMRQVAPGLELHAFSYIADDPELSEEKWIDMAAQSVHARLHKVRLPADELKADLETLVYMQDQPFGSSSPYAQYCVFRAARDTGIKVMLDGQGADEILGGYRFYMAARLASLLKQRHWIEALQFIAHCSKLPDVGTSWLLWQSMDYLLPSWIQGPPRRAIGKELIPAWLNAEWFADRNVHPSGLNTSGTQDVLRENLCRTLLHTTLPGLLRYEDRNSMAFSIESRVPFLTPELVQFLLSLPEEYIIAQDGTPKAVFREAMRGLVPDSILARRDKIGFATPEEGWLRRLHRWVSELLESDAASTLHFFRLERMRSQWSEIDAGRKPMSPYIWRWLNLILWTEKFKVLWT